MLRQVVVLLTTAIVLGAEPNPPQWPPNVFEFTPGNDGATQAKVNQIYNLMGGHTPPDHGQFNPERYAFLFKPGNHGVDVQVGFYTSVIGTGLHPSQTLIRNVICQNGDFNVTGGALDNFWRSAENFQTTPTMAWNGQVSMLWAVSQGVTLRSVVVNGPLMLYQYNGGGGPAGYASGGFMADVSVSGTVIPGSQQQFFLRNVKMQKFAGGVWNFLLMGCPGAPPTHCDHTGQAPITNIASTPVVAEKPYIVATGAGYSLAVPILEHNKVGPTTAATRGQAKMIDFSQVYVATVKDTADTINAKLATGLHLVLTPGIYNLTHTIAITHANTVVLGMGMATLVPEAGMPAITVSNVDGVRIGGILLQAGHARSAALLQWGDPNTPYAGNPTNPGFLYDVHGRVGGPTNSQQEQVATDSVIALHNGNIVLDNSWLWRADHDKGGEVKASRNPSDHGLVVTGDDVTTYGLACEHHLKDLVLWSGEGGRAYFYQSELPYDVTQTQFGTPGYAGFRVADTVQKFSGWAVGVYSYFRDFAVTTTSGIKTGTAAGVQFKNSLSVFLNGQGGITHVINDQGAAVTQGAAQKQAYVC